MSREGVDVFSDQVTPLPIDLIYPYIPTNVINQCNNKNMNEKEALNKLSTILQEVILGMYQNFGKEYCEHLIERIDNIKKNL